MNKYILIPDSFKGTLSSMDICQTMTEAITAMEKGAKIIAIPVADGGEGTVDAFLQAIGGLKINLEVSGPYGETVTAFYGKLDETTAVIEMAAAAGLPLVGENRNAEETTTFGVGQLIVHALQSGAKEIILGLGGSATNDGGCGMACALGVRFWNQKGKRFVPIGKTLMNIAKIDCSNAHPLLKQSKVRIMCDIDNPLCGEQGAAAVFGPQKGADQPMVTRLDEGLRHMAQIVARDLNCDILNLSGAGAAGGMGGGTVAFLGGKLQMGIDTILEMTHFEEKLDQCTAVFTGEGKLDGQSLRGKVVVGVARCAKKHKVPVIAIVGSIADEIGSVYNEGVTAIFSINRSPLAYAQAILRSKQNLYATTQDVLRCLLSLR